MYFSADGSPRFPARLMPPENLGGQLTPAEINQGIGYTATLITVAESWGDHVTADQLRGIITDAAIIHAAAMQE